MTEYVTYITIGNNPDALRDFIVEQYGVTKEQAQSVLDSDPYKPTSREARYQWIKRVVAKLKILRS